MVATSHDNTIIMLKATISLNPDIFSWNRLLLISIPFNTERAYMCFASQINYARLCQNDLIYPLVQWYSEPHGIFI